MSDDPVEVLPMLKAKLDDSVKERDELQAALKVIREKLDLKLKKAPKKPAVSVEKLQDEIEDLEYRRETQSMSLRDEKEILRQIASLRMQKAGMAEHTAYQAEIEALRAKRAEKTEALHAAQNAVRELRDYVRKLEVLERVRSAHPGTPITAADLRVAEMKVAADTLPRLIGKGGASLKQLEEAAGVTLDVDFPFPRAGDKAAAAAAAGGAGAAGTGKDKDGKPAAGKGAAAGGAGTGKGASAAAAAAAAGDAAAAAAPSEATIRIMGLESGIIAAVSLIESVVKQIEETITLTGGLLSYLLSKNGAALKELESAYGLRLRVDRDAKALHVRGLPTSITTARQVLAALDAGKSAVTIEARMLPGLMGKGGANLKRVREATGAEIEIVKEGDKDHKVTTTGTGDAATVTLHIYGTSTAIAAATAELARVAEEIREEEVEVEIPRDAVPWLVGSGGERISAFQTETGVYARVVRADDDAAAAAASASTARITLRGTPKNLTGALPVFEALLADYHRCNRTLVINAAQARALVGPGGATIKQLRADTGASIEVVEPGREEKASGKKAAGAAAAAAEDAAATAADAAALTAAIAAATGGKKADKATGKEEKGKAAGDKKAAAGAAATATAAEEDKKDAGKERSRAPRRNRAEELGLTPGQAAVTIRGPDAEKVDAALAAITALIAAYTEVTVTVTGAVISALVVNKGELVSAIQKETGAVIDIARAPGAPTGKGAPPAGGSLVISGAAPAVGAAAERVAALAASRQERLLPLPDASVIPSIVGKGGEAIKALQAETGVDIDVDKAALALRIVGTPEAIEGAVEKVKALLEKHSKENAVMFVDPLLIRTLIGKGGASIKALQEETGATLHFEGPDGARSGEIRIHGPEAAVIAAQERIRQVCHLNEAVDSLTIPVPALGPLIGKGGSNVRRIEETHRVSIAADTATGVFTLRGEPAAIEAAKKALRRQTREALKVEADVPVPQERVGAVIGPKGARIRQLEAETDASVDLPKDRTTATVHIRVRGTPLAVEKAKAVIGAIAAGKAVRALPRPGHAVFALRARDAAPLAALASGLEVDPVTLFDADAKPAPIPGEEVDAAAEAEDEPLALVLVTGASEAKVALAAEVVDKRIAALFPSTYAIVRVPAGLVEELTSTATTAAGGRRKAAAAPASPAGGAGTGDAAAGEGEEEEAAAAAAPAIVPDETLRLAAIKARVPGLHAAADAATGYIVLWTDASAPAAAASAAITAGKAALADAVKSYNGRHATVPVESWMLPSFIGKKGVGIITLQKETGCTIDADRAEDAARGGAGKPKFIDGTTGVIAISAPSAAALAVAKERVTAAIAALAKRRVVLVVPHGAFGPIIGKGGATIRAIQEESGASIDLERDRGLIAIRGNTEEEVAHARELIEEAIGGADADEEGEEGEGGKKAGGARETLRVATAADMAPLPARVVPIPGGDKAVLAALIGPGASGLRDIEASSGASLHADREAVTVTIRAKTDAAMARAAHALDRAIDFAVDAAEAKAAKAAAAAPAAPSVSVLAARGATFRPVGMAPPSAAEMLAEAGKAGGRNARKRAKKAIEDSQAAAEAAEAAAAAARAASAAPVVAALPAAASKAAAAATGKAALATLTADELLHAVFAPQAAAAPARSAAAAAAALPASVSAVPGIPALAALPSVALPVRAAPASAAPAAAASSSSLLPSAAAAAATLAAAHHAPAPLVAAKPGSALASAFPFGLPAALALPTTTIALPGASGASAGSAAAAAALALGHLAAPAAPAAARVALPVAAPAPATVSLVPVAAAAAVPVPVAAPAPAAPVPPATPTTIVRGLTLTPLVSPHSAPLASLLAAAAAAPTVTTTLLPGAKPLATTTLLPTAGGAARPGSAAAAASLLTSPAAGGITLPAAVAPALPAAAKLPAWGAGNVKTASLFAAPPAAPAVVVAAAPAVVAAPAPAVVAAPAPAAPAVVAAAATPLLATTGGLTFRPVSSNAASIIAGITAAAPAAAAAAPRATLLPTAALAAAAPAVAVAAPAPATGLAASLQGLHLSPALLASLGAPVASVAIPTGTGPAATTLLPGASRPAPVAVAAAPAGSAAAALGLLGSGPVGLPASLTALPVRPMTVLPTSTSAAPAAAAAAPAAAAAAPRGGAAGRGRRVHA